MVKAFCPGHITCFFSPQESDDMMMSGSVGAGICLNKGTHVTMTERKDRSLRVIMDGGVYDTRVSSAVIRALAPNKGFDVNIENQLPVSQGMGMSAAGAIAIGLCLCSLYGMDESEAYKAAHIAEITNGGGLGDVLGIMGRGQPVRTVAGMPPYGKVKDSGISMDLTVAVLGPKVETGSVLNDGFRMHTISVKGAECLTEYLRTPSEDSLYRISSIFSASIGLETPKMKDAMKKLRNSNYNVSMCMLGNSIFTNADVTEVHRILGDDVKAIPCSSDRSGAAVTQKE